MIDTKELRRLAQAALIAPGSLSPEWMDRLGQFQEAADPSAISELLDRLETVEKDAAHQKALADSALRVAEGWERKCDSLRAKVAASTEAWKSADKACYDLTEKVIPNLREQVEAAEKERDWHAARCEDAMNECTALRAKITEMERQEPVGKFIRHPSNWLWEQDGYGDNPDARPLYALPGAQQCKNCNGMGDRFDPSGEKIPCDLCEKIYALPGAQPVPSVPREAIEKMLTQLMDIAVSNGANSVSMPDEYVEVAAWLCGIPAQPAPSVPDGWKEAAIAWEVCASIHREYGKGKDPFFNTRQGDFVKHANDARAMLAAAPEATP